MAVESDREESDSAPPPSRLTGKRGQQKPAGEGSKKTFLIVGINGGAK